MEQLAAGCWRRQVWPAEWRPSQGASLPPRLWKTRALVPVLHAEGLAQWLSHPFPPSFLPLHAKCLVFQIICIFLYQRGEILLPGCGCLTGEEEDPENLDEFTMWTSGNRPAKSRGRISQTMSGRSVWEENRSVCCSRSVYSANLKSQVRLLEN